MAYNNDALGSRKYGVTGGVLQEAETDLELEVHGDHSERKRETRLGGGAIRR